MQKKLDLYFYTKIIKILLSALMIFSIFFFGYLYYLSKNLPDLSAILNPKYNLPTQIFDRNDELIDEYYTERRILIPIKKVPKQLIQALIAIEDRNFFHHYGVAPIRMIKAMLINFMHVHWKQGASTLTQQTAKMFLLSSEKKLVRKFKEILLALKIEHSFSKMKILELYLNKAYFGHGAWGVEAAAQGYFNKNTEELSLTESAMLAGLVQRPSYWNPYYNKKNALDRRNIVLKAMKEVGFISKKVYKKEIKTPIILRSTNRKDSNDVAYYLEHVRKILFEKFGANQLYSGGLKVHIAMDLKLQVKAQKALEEGLETLEQRRGFRGVIQNILQDDASFSQEKIDEIIHKNKLIIGEKVFGIVKSVEQKEATVILGKKNGSLFLSNMKWTRPYDQATTLDASNQVHDIRKVFNPGDVIEVKILDYNQNQDLFILALTQRPIPNGGFFAMDPRTGHVLAISGGFDFNQSEFNRAIQSKRQPGSAFKPIIYAAALDNKYTTASILEDTPLVYENIKSQMPAWKPGNYSNTFRGKLSLRNALVHSKNIPTIKLAMNLGLDKVIEYAHKLGIKHEIPRDYTIAIGTSSVTLEEMIKVYSVFANGGNLVTPIYITKIEDRYGNIIEENLPIIQPVLSEETSFLMTSILSDVVKRGTGWRARDLNRPCAGKTGTTNNYVDAWFIGYIPQIIAGVYIGNDLPNKSLGIYETGSRAALPVWLDFMKFATEALPSEPFSQPPTIDMVKIHPKSGLLACKKEKNAIFEFFKPQTAPNQCHETSSYHDYDRQKKSDFENSIEEL